MGTFAVLLSTYILIETHIKEVYSIISEKYTVPWIGFILKVNLGEEILVPQKPPKLFFSKIIFQGV